MMMRLLGHCAVVLLAYNDGQIEWLEYHDAGYIN